jgi:predicted Ser/Thr protein kinase
MNSEQRHRVRDLFEAAFDRDSRERVAWAVQQAADDHIVRDEIVSLLDHHARAGSFLTDPILERMPDLLADEGPLAPGTMVGTYTIVRELGRGGMGRVYLASDARLGRYVALKALAPHLTSDPSHRERLRHEARATAALTHQGICTVYALEEIGEDVFLVTEFVDGHTLREEIATGRRPSTDDILQTARELAAALASAHARGITHRDLKPENVMRAHDGRLKILDFGLARVSVPFPSAAPAFATDPGLLVGTPAYMAPEQLNGTTVDARADVFSFGVLLYEFITGTHPFEGSTPLATIARILESEARPLAERCPHVPSAVIDVLERCLRKAPADRLRSAADIVSSLRHVEGSVAGGGHTTWWRVHQLVIMASYVVATAIGWQIKEWIPTPTTVSLFVALGIGATIGGLLRGHLVFTERMNRSGLTTERRRVARTLMLVDALLGVVLLSDAALVVHVRPVAAVLTMGLALGIALAALVFEAATSRAAFGGEGLSN